MKIPGLLTFLLGIEVMCLFSSCVNESNEPYINDLKSDYISSWIKRYDMTDPNQNWNSAEKCEIFVDEQTLGVGGRMCVYTDNPANGGLLILEVDKPGTYTTTVSKGTSELYVRLYDGANYIEGKITLTSGAPSRVTPDSRGEVHVDNPQAESRAYKCQNFRWLIAIEDLGDLTENDFNDVVIGLNYKDGDNKVYVTALAAGGWLEVKVCYKDTYIFESHQGLGSPKKKTGTYPTMNTGNFTGEGKTYEVIVDDDFDITNNMGDFKFVVSHVNGRSTRDVIIEAPQYGEAPQMILFPGTWLWPVERVSIEKAYPNFKDWNKSADYDFFNSAKKSKNVIAR